ncbi:hypothetical protein WA171_006136 [Blastocystis sp. BT1]
MISSRNWSFQLSEHTNSFDLSVCVCPMDALSEYLSTVKPKKEKEVSSLQEKPLFQDTGRKLKFRAASELHDKDNDSSNDSNEKSVVIPEDLHPSQRISLFDQLKENKKREEDELAERRKLMYGVRPMDDEEYKDYEQMEIARRERERITKEKMDYEEKQFKLMQRDTMLAEDEDTELLECDEMIKGRVQNLIFGKQTKIDMGKKTSKLRVRRKEKDGKKNEKEQNNEKKEKSTDKVIHEKSQGISHLLYFSDSDSSV